MKKTILALSMAAVAIPVLPTTAEARHQYSRHSYRTTDNGIRYWRGNDGRYYCHRRNGTTGLLIGGVAGALVGRAIDSHGSRATGTILGAAAGALAGRAVERSSARCR